MRWHSFLVFLSILCLTLSTIGCGGNDAAANDGAPGVSNGGARNAGTPSGQAGSGAKTSGREGGGRSSGSGRPSGGARPGGGAGWGGGGGAPKAAVPVEVTPVARRSISAFLETNGTLEAENDVDVLARTNGPVVELLVEEGMRVKAGRLLARLDADEARARMEISRVNRNDAKVAFDRAQTLYDDHLLSQQDYDQAKSTYDSAEAQLLGEQIVFGYTEIKAPFDGVISMRYIKLAQNVSNNERLFRVTSFEPLLCPIQVPERELPRLSIGQSAYVTVEAWPEERFSARVLRISPVVNATTGTVKVTLEISARGKLRPGMFTGVFLETETRPDALVVPRAALSLESIGDTVYVAAGETASRREVELGFQEGDYVELRSGVQEGENVIVVGQDGLSDGTPIQVLRTTGLRTTGLPPLRTAGGPRRDAGGPPGDGGTPGAPAAASRPADPPGGPGRRGFDPSNMTPERLEFIKQRMKERGLSDQQIEERLKQMKDRAGGNPP